ncbi:MAG: sigma-54 dependent transcriptional regulator [Deltaproteobacteria bacterium]|nr:sigma-54 dependent transcriptional regulator [Deltaproteobacteria bacterium]
MMNAEGNAGPMLVCATDSPIEQMRRAAIRVAGSDATVLLSGETGTGKEVMARLIHQSSSRADHAFVPVNCGAIPAALLESELFGHTRGAFTDATSTRMGRVAMAQGGTLFLDEIGDLPLGLQVKLLRLIQERSYEPVGSSQSVSANFRLIAATNRDLAVEVAAARFRSDLYYRLCVCPMRLPALRERSEDIPVLFSHFWRKRGELRAVDAAVLERLRRHGWPGNVRELENLVERLSVCSESSVIRLSDLPAELLQPSSAPPDAASGLGLDELDRLIGMPLLLDAEAAEGDIDLERRPAQRVVRPFVPQNQVEASMFSRSGFPKVELQMSLDLPEFLHALEAAFIDEALQRTGNNKKEAAALLGMGRTTLVEKLRRRGVENGRKAIGLPSEAEG